MAHALDVAARRWPDEPRSRLLLRLVRLGSAVLEQELSTSAGNHVAALDATSGKYEDAFPDGYLAELRRDWPE